MSYFEFPRLSKNGTRIKQIRLGENVDKNRFFSFIIFKNQSRRFGISVFPLGNPFNPCPIYRYNRVPFTSII
jgi:hypothetical protein